MGFEYWRVVTFGGKRERLVAQALMRAVAQGIDTLALLLAATQLTAAGVFRGPTPHTLNWPGVSFGGGS